MTRNNVEYTLWSAAQSAHVQHSATLYSCNPLTYRGAERIIRREINKAAVVTMLTAAQEAR